MAMRLTYSDDKSVFQIHTDRIPYLSVKLLDRIGVPNLYSTRFLSYDDAAESGREGLRVVVMKEEDPAQAAPVVFESRDRLARQLGASIEMECVTDQMHTSRVYLVRPEDLGPILRGDKPERRRSVDGVITDLPGAVLTAFGGDCPPVYLADPVRRAIGLVHAGWRGTLGRIPAAAIRRIKEEFGTDPRDLYAAIGPGICQDCYEMGHEVRQMFSDQWGEDQAEKIFRDYPAFAEDGSPIPGGKPHLDLREANRMTLLAEGVPEDRIAVSNVCTKCNADVFYSFRAGRMENEQAAMIVNRWEKREDRAKEIYDLFLARSSKDDEFSDWAGYREQLTDFILENAPAGGSLLILGAGKCNDLDLGRLADHCGTMTLSDYRPETAEDAFRRYGLSPSERLNFLPADYVGIGDEDYLEYTRLLIAVMQRLQSRPGDSLEETAGQELKDLLEGLEEIYRRNRTYEIDLGDRTYDSAVICGVHSQLNNSFRGIFQYARKSLEETGDRVRFAEELNSAIFHVTREHTGDLVRRFNEAAFAAVREGMVYGYEENILYKPPGESVPVIGTVDGARQAGEAIADLPVKDHMKCLWPLSRRRDIRFEMSISYLRTEQQ